MHRHSCLQHGRGSTAVLYLCGQIPEQDVAQALYTQRLGWQHELFKRHLEPRQSGHLRTLRFVALEVPGGDTTFLDDATRVCVRWLRGAPASRGCDMLAGVRRLAEYGRRQQRWVCHPGIVLLRLRLLVAMRRACPVSVLACSRKY